MILVFERDLVLEAMAERVTITKKAPERTRSVALLTETLQGYYAVNRPDNSGLPLHIIEV